MQPLRALVPAVKELLFRMVDRHPAILNDWVTPSWSLGTVRDGKVSLLEGALRAVDEQGATVAEFPVEEYDRHLVESVLDWSYMKQVHFSHKGAAHEYRVGPLARINAVGTYGTDWADREYAAFREQFGAPCHATVLQSYAKLIELIWAVEYAGTVLDNPLIHGETRVPVTFGGGRGVGHVEVPRGTLIHDYEIDGNGIIRAANLIVATQQNYTLINRTVRQAAESHVIGRTDDAALLNAIEFGIRCYDPCLSCATHAVGQMPLEVVITRERSVMKSLRRGN